MAKKSGHKGVTQHGESWCARTTINGKTHHLGHFPFTEQGALRAANKIAAFRKGARRAYIKKHVRWTRLRNNC